MNAAAAAAMLVVSLSPLAHSGAPAQQWGCCADRDAASCSACRWWAHGAFCELHAVNCATCGFSLYCPDPAKTPPPAPPAPPPRAFMDLQCHHGHLLDCSHGGDCSAEKFRIKGISWFGMEEKYAILQGLEVVSMGSLLDLIERNGFNTIRVPLSVTSTLHDPKANMFGGGVVQENPQFNGLRYHEVVDVLVRDAGRRHLLILLDMHRLSAGDRNNALWWDATVSEQQLIDAWLKLAARHCSSWNVIGADLFNEPWGAAWGHGPVNQDWAAAAERIGAAVSKACPRWLLFVEGVSHTTSNDEPAVRGQSDRGHMWASNLEGVASRPLAALPDASKLVYSPHVYGPSVAPQPYFSEEGFPGIMGGIWETHFGYVASSGKGCVVVGEWGGWFTGSDAVWQRAFSQHLAKHHIGSFYWALNPTSRDTGGLVLADWKTPNTLKLEMLASIPSTQVREAPLSAPGMGREEHGQHDIVKHEQHNHHEHDHNGRAGHYNASSTDALGAASKKTD